MSLQKKISFIGGGAMGSAMLGGMLQKGIVAKRNVIVADLLPAARERAATMGVQATDSALAAAKQCDIAVICVKPIVLKSVLNEIHHELSNKLVISIAAGVKLQTLSDLSNPTLRWVRVMPNTACLVGESASSFTPSSSCTDTDINITKQILESCGISILLKNEDLLDAATGVAGSGIAYVYLFIEALADGAVRAGLPRTTAIQLATQTVLGGALMQKSTTRHPMVLKDEVCSPGGTTIEAVSALEEHGLRNAVIKAVTAAYEKSKSMGGTPAPVVSKL
eukprot:TRINITY_DN6880_c1_g1_i1.p1 TRINITY_DN6880_c1_g1~~TRINITY_DN6880_c1_g1_i1.p1  ORF type:complete len:279 (+),score=59.39 TRINITY_DN6880_c1_g1_i1:160-996(+)